MQFVKQFTNGKKNLQMFKVIYVDGANIVNFCTLMSFCDGEAC